MLQSAQQYGDNVQRVIITSSCASVLTPDIVPRTFSEKDWNEKSVKEVETKGSSALPHEMYRASKTLAERAAWRFAEDNKDKIKFDIVVLNPPFVWGPTVHEVAKAEDLNTSMVDWYNTVVKGTRTEEQLVSIRFVYFTRTVWSYLTPAAVRPGSMSAISA